MIVRLSVYERAMTVLFIEGDGRSCMRRVKKVGERIAPRGILQVTNNQVFLPNSILLPFFTFFLSSLCSTHVYGENLE